MNNLDIAMKLMGEELAITSNVAVEVRVKNRLVAECKIDESEAAAYAAVAFRNYLEAYTE